ncbi:MAG: right-handed parallel beta-helix repeat-containing protein [Candidatus Woesearchaeota archaeon]
MKKRCLLLVLFMIILSTAVQADCQKPMNGKTYTSDKRFCSNTFYLPDGIIVGRDNIVIDCNHAVLKGNNFEGIGIIIKNKNNVVIKNCKIANYAVGISIQDSKNITFYGNTLMRNNMGIRLYQVSDSTFCENRDISLDRIMRMIESQNNTISFTNKKIEEDFCRYNWCNAKVIIDENKEDKEALIKLLKSAIKEWMAS